MNKFTTAVAALLATTAVSAAQAEELRMSSTAPETSPWGVWLAAAGERVAELTDGELTLNIFYGGQLGDEQATMNLLIRGRIDIAAVSTSAAGLVEPGLEAIHLPFAWSSDAEFDGAVDNHLMPMIGDILSSNNIVPIGSFEVPAFVLFSRQAIASPGDLVGQNWRAVPTRVSVGFLNALGAHGVPLGNADMVTSLQTGAVDGAETSGLYGIAIGLNQIAPHLLMTQQTRVVGLLMMPGAVWERLSEEHRAALSEAFSDVDSLRVNVRGVERSMIDNAAANGLTVVELNDTTRAEWQQAAADSYDTLLTEIGGRAREVWATVQEAQAACSN